MKTFFSIFLCLALSGLSQAATPSPVGQWQTIDDETGEAKSLVTLWLKNGELMGRIDTLLNPEEPIPICEECSGARKNQPVEAARRFPDFPVLPRYTSPGGAPAKLVWTAGEK